MYVGLSGGIGSGKSTIASMFAKLGAEVIDADSIAREVIAIGTPGLEQVVAAFGASILDASGGIDRGFLAQLVFADRTKLTTLEQIIHPLVISRVAEIRSAAPADAVVIYDTPLLVEKQMMPDFDAVVIVLAKTELRVERLIARGLNRTDISNRIANQATDDERTAAATFVIHNDGSLLEAEAQVAKVWSALTS
jgi:dephospho-CoA kinase